MNEFIPEEGIFSKRYRLWRKLTVTHKRFSLHVGKTCLLIFPDIFYRYYIGILHMQAIHGFKRFQHIIVIDLFRIFSGFYIGTCE
jgi:hypothetical protein